MKIKKGYEIFAELIANAERQIIIEKAKNNNYKVEHLKRQIEAFKKIACEKEEK